MGGRFLACAAGGLILALVVTIAAQQGRLRKASADLAAQTLRLGETQAVNNGLACALDRLETVRERSEQLVLETADRADDLAARARSLERQLKEALTHAHTLDLDAPLPFDAIAALCLRHATASGAGPHYRQGNAPAGAAARTADPGAGLCAGWRQVTLRETLEWLGLLLDHAGAERLDKAALRQWAGQE